MSKPAAPGPPPKSKGPPRRASAAPAGGGTAEGPGPEDIPCRSSNRAAWKYLLLAAIFLAWLAFLIYCAVGGNG